MIKFPKPYLKFRLKKKKKKIGPKLKHGKVWQGVCLGPAHRVRQKLSVSWKRACWY